MQDVTEQSPMNNPLAFITAREAAHYLRISISTLNRMERKGMITSYRTIGRHRRYTLEMLNVSLSYGVKEIG